jgi:hypothetical protein
LPAVADAIRHSFKSDVVLRRQARRHLPVPAGAALMIAAHIIPTRDLRRCKAAVVAKRIWPIAGSRRMDLHRKPFEAAQHIVVMACGFSGELDRFDLAHEGAENRFTFEPSHCLPDAAVNAGS